MILKQTILLATILLMSFHPTWAHELSSLRDVNFQKEKVNKVYQDKNGFVWIGTDAGLFRFDGVHSILYFRDPNNLNSLSNNSVNDIAEDRFGNIWIATDEGLNKLDPKAGKIIKYFASSESRGLKSNSIKCLLIDKNDVLWMGTKGDGLMEMNLSKQDNAVLTHAHNSSKNYSISSNEIYDLQEDRNGILWIATQNGLNRLLLYDSERSQEQPADFSLYNTDLDKPESSSLGWNVNCLFLDSRNRLWAGDQSGLNMINTATSSINEAIKYNYYSEFDLSQLNPGSGPVLDVCEDEWGKIVISMEFGLKYLEEKQNEFLDYNSAGLHNFSRPSSIIKLRSGELLVGSGKQGILVIPKNSQNFGFVGSVNDVDLSSVTAFMPMESGKIWLGTFGSGIVEVSQYSASYLIENQPNIDPWISSFLRLSNGTVLIGGYGNSPLLSFTNESGFAPVESNLAEYPNGKNIRSMFLDSRGFLWIASYGSGLFYCENPQSQPLVFANISQESESNLTISDNNVAGIVEDEKGRIWIGTDAGGLNLVDLEKKATINLLHKPNVKESLSSNIINVLFRDSSNIWVGTKNGLDLVYYENDSILFKHFGISEGILGESVLGIVRSGNNLWLSTNKGINRFNLNNFKSSSFSQSDGTGISEYLFNSFYKSVDGKVYFGGVEGFNQFFPNQIEEQIDVPQASITSLRVIQRNNNPTEKGADTYEELLPGSVSSNLILKHFQNSLFVEYSPIVYANVDELRYRYKIRANQENWTLNGNSHELNFSDLPPGKYDLQIQTGTISGKWSTSSTQLTIEILPPLWKSRAAYWIYVLLIFAAANVLLLLYFRRVRLRSRLTFESMEREKLEELSGLKEKLFTNISHEFRTPLTLILSPLEKLRETIKNEGNIKVLAGIEKNGNELLKLINQLLDLNKLEAGHLQVDEKVFSASELFAKILSRFEAKCLEKNIDIKLNAIYLPKKLISDPNKIDTITSNIIANAIKFSHEGSEINVKVEHVNGDLFLEVDDEAGGISNDLKEKVFDRYFRVGNQEEGTGIGLSLVRELVELLDGKIEILDSRLGSIFSVRIPVKELQKPLIEVKEDDNLNLQKKKQFSVLIADDKAEIVELLVGLLEDEYHLIKASDGQEGLNLCQEHLPDLVLSDVMMPKMDGFEFCEAVKSDELTNHIPVILLTAKGGSKARISGLRHGADDYIEKPFSNEELLLRVKNQLKLTEAIRLNIASYSGVLSSEGIPGPQRDFVSKLYKLIQENISNADFKVYELAREIGMSRMNLNRKLKAIGSQTPSELLRKVRLENARKLIESGAFNVSESAFASGMNNLSHFTKMFKEEFGELPSEFASKLD